MNHPLPLTGERTLPGIAEETYWFARHLAAYRAVDALLGAGRILDAGPGEGYGADLLAAAPGRTVTGVDYDRPATRHARAAYPRLGVVRGNVVGLPFADAAFDAVVGLQVIEHLYDQDGHLADCARVLRPGGTLVVGTPNRLTFSPGYHPDTGRPANPYHTREFSPAELTALVARHAGVHTVLGVHPGDRLRALDDRLRATLGADLVTAQLATPAPDWPAELRAAVAAVTPDDFTVTADPPADEALDVIVVGTRGPHPACKNLAPCAS